MRAKGVGYFTYREGKNIIYPVNRIYIYYNKYLASFVRASVCQSVSNNFALFFPYPPLLEEAV